MFYKSRIERIFKYLVDDEQRIEQHEVEIMRLKAKVEELETEFNRRLNSLKEELLDSDKFVGYLHGCANDNYDLINGLRDRVIKLEEACIGYAEAFKVLADSDKKLVAVLDDCETRINLLENDRAEMKKRMRELEERKCHCEERPIDTITTSCNSGAKE